MQNYLAVAQTSSTLDLQCTKGSHGRYDTDAPGPTSLTVDEITHIRAANSCYMATVNEDGWPYVQHRGGDTGFVRQLGPTTIGWVERNGNRQYLSTSNIRAGGRVALIFVDYAARTRLKLFGTATYHAEIPPRLADELNPDGLRNDGGIVVDVIATAWNCPKYITPRVEIAEVQPVIRQLQSRIEELEAQLAHAVDA